MARDFERSLSGDVHLPALVSELRPSRIFIVTEESLSKQFGAAFQEFLGSAVDCPLELITFPGGEKGKHLDSLGPVFNRLIDGGVDRRSLLMALGGGVVGDFAGFVAATILRGIPFVQIPTTLLSMVDSSVGGKVAVNTGKGKNMVGAFYHPSAVWCNLGSLQSLPDDEWACGLAEMAKHAMLESSGQVRQRLMDSANSIKEPETLAPRILESMSVKAFVVARDEKESGLRACLNLGHTTAHGIESLSDYSRFSHGQAVSRGLVTALLLSGYHGFSRDELQKNLVLMEQLNLPMDTAGFESEQLWQHMKFDKKNVGGEIRFVLMTENGLELSVPVQESEFEKAWKEQKERYG
ncbi:MAG: 3-dehydroquinate synthase [Leptospiraceae bacterium]|nr:3-dehydroquinate synthase [Leptospiraceae bacterium]